MSKLLKSFAVLALLVAGGQVMADAHNPGGGGGPIHTNQLPVPHQGK